MADDGLALWRQDRDRNLAEIRNLEAVLARMEAADSTAGEPTRQLIVLLQKRVADVQGFLSAHGSGNALEAPKARGAPPT